MARQLKQIIKEGSAPVAGASYMSSSLSQSRKVYDIYMFRVGDFKVYVASIDGEVANDGELLWFFKSDRDAARQIAKWR